MKEAKTTLIYKERTYPFYETIRAKWDFEAAGYSNDGLIAGRTREMVAMIFFTVRECARRSGLGWTDSIEEFVDNIDSSVFEVFGRLAEAREKAREEVLRGKLKPKPAPELAEEPPKRHSV